MTLKGNNKHRQIGLSSIYKTANKRLARRTINIMSQANRSGIKICA
jgi:hypothetical protein